MVIIFSQQELRKQSYLGTLTCRAPSLIKLAIAIAVVLTVLSLLSSPVAVRRFRKEKKMLAYSAPFAIPSLYCAAASASATLKSTASIPTLGRGADGPM
jgi:hypothetical protein